MNIGTPLKSMPQKYMQNECIGVNRGGRSTKIDAVVDALGNPVYVLLTAGNVNDSSVAQTLLAQVDIRGTVVLADKAYGSWAFREYVSDQDADLCIPPKSNESDPWFYDCRFALLIHADKA